MGDTIIFRRFDNLRFSVLVNVIGIKAKFTIYEQAATGEDGKIYYDKKGSGQNAWCKNHEDADVFLSGEVNWDGVSNWYFDEQDRSALHEGSKSGLLRYGLIMGECWDIASSMLPNWMGVD